MFDVPLLLWQFVDMDYRETAEKRLLVELAVVSAARQGEIVAIEEKHLNTEKNTLLIEQALVNLTVMELL